MRTHFFVIAFLLLVGLNSQAQESPKSQRSSPPLTVSDIEHGLNAGMTNTRMAALVKLYGVDFELTDAVEKDLRAAGANGDLLLAISRSKGSGRTSEKDHSAEPKPTNAPPTTQTHASTGARDSVDLFFRMRPGIGYLHIAQFNETTDKEVQDALDSFYQSGELKGLTLDLRQSSGGLPNEAVGVADKFLHKGQPIVPDHGCSSSESHYTAMHGNGGKDYPLVVLIDGGTASAAELVAGTIQDHDRGLVAGETTHSFDVAANREVKLTDSGRTAYCGGITPDVRIDSVKSNSFQNTLLQHQVETDPNVLRALDLLPMAQALMENAKKIIAERNSTRTQDSGAESSSSSTQSESERGTTENDMTLASGAPCMRAPSSLSVSLQESVEHYNNGAQFLNSGRYPQGRDELGLAIVENPASAPSYYWRGIALLGLSTVTADKKIQASEETIACFQMYLAISPDGPLAKNAKEILGTLAAPLSTATTTKHAALVTSMSQNTVDTHQAVDAHDCVVRGVTPAPPGEHWPVVALQNVCSKAISVAFCWLVDDLPDNGWGCWESRIDAGKSTSYNEMDEAKMSCIEGHYPGTVSPDPSCSQFKIIWNATYQDSGQRPERPNVPRNPNQTAR